MVCSEKPKHYVNFRDELEQVVFAPTPISSPDNSDNLVSRHLSSRPSFGITWASSRDLRVGSAGPDMVDDRAVAFRTTEL
jgi:hypothetical protein